MHILNLFVFCCSRLFVSDLLLFFTFYTHLNWICRCSSWYCRTLCTTGRVRTRSSSRAPRAQAITSSFFRTVCQRSFEFYYIQWVKTSWTDSIIYYYSEGKGCFPAIMFQAIPSSRILKRRGKRRKRGGIWKRGVNSVNRKQENWPKIDLKKKRQCPIDTIVY